MTPFTTQEISATVSIDSKLFRSSAHEMQRLSSCMKAKDAAQGLLIATLSDIAERQYMTHPPLPNDGLNEGMIDKKSNRLLESARSTYISTRSALFAPLEDYEKPAPYLAGSANMKGILHQILHTMKILFVLPWPLMHWIPGLRQISSLPVPNASSPEDEEIRRKKK